LEDWLMENRRQTAAAMETSSPIVIAKPIRNSRRSSAESYGNPFSREYMTEDADVVLIVWAPLSTPCKGFAIRKMRQEGKKSDWGHLRWFRPFAAEENGQDAQPLQGGWGHRP